MNIIFDTQPDHPRRCDSQGLVGLSELGTAQVRYSEQSLQSLLQSAASVDKLFDALEVGGSTTEISRVRAGAAEAVRGAVASGAGGAVAGGSNCAAAGLTRDDDAKVYGEVSEDEEVFSEADDW